MGSKQTTTDPTDPCGVQSAPRLTIAPSVKDATGADWVHADYQRATEPWQAEQHIPPISRTERLGSVESWAAYVTSYALPDAPLLLTWSESGLRAILDYHLSADEPGRCTWVAVHPLEQAVQWRRWTELANGRPRGQRDVLEALEDNAEDIVEPAAADLVGLLRKLRATVSAQAETTLNADGTSSVSWQKSSAVNQDGGGATLPAEIVIAVPVFKGHTDVNDEGKQVPVRFALRVRVRVSVGDDAKLTFRLSMPQREATLEMALADRVAAAEMALGDGYRLLRATTSNAVI
jgi:Uncharacterized conserved protein (DUF2303)